MRSGKIFAHRIIATALLGLLAPAIASAYVGPGAGISMLGALWGLIVGVVMAVGVILFWPIRIMIRKAKANKAASALPAENPPEVKPRSDHGQKLIQVNTQCLSIT